MMAGRIGKEEKGIFYRFKPIIIICCCIGFSLWWLGLNNQPLDERVYSREAHNQDVSKIYFDLGRSSEKRGDWASAINLYTIALQHAPDLIEAYDRLAACYKYEGQLKAARQACNHSRSSRSTFR